MRKIIHIPVPTDALDHAGRILEKSGFLLTDFPDEADCILLPVPTPEGCSFPADRAIPVFGGNLGDRFPGGTDLLKDPRYLAENAKITAQAALGLLLPELMSSFEATPVLILGWGRIGKLLSAMMKRLGFPVAIAARKEANRALAEALGFGIYDPNCLSRYRIIVNTADSPVIREEDLALLRPDCLLLDLASRKQLPGNRVIHARGLPGRCRPEASGALIARFVAEYLEKGVN